ncbi:RNA polymerase sigma factor, sigma-70 family [Lachnospiraceae bacterium KHCPX20]|nr:RNA polymerase sigma factor, sigma-70 family [Lachnospiraceae bacterium KHCPX20]
MTDNNMMRRCRILLAQKLYLRNKLGLDCSEQEHDLIVATYEQLQKMIGKFHSRNNLTSMDADDLFDEACIEFLQFCKNYRCSVDPVIQSWVAVQNRLKSLTFEDTVVRIPYSTKRGQRFRGVAEEEQVQKPVISYCGSGEVVDRIPAKTNPEDEIIQHEQIEMMLDAIKLLSTKEQSIIKKYYGVDGEDPTSLVNISKELGISKQLAGYYRDRALQKMRSVLVKNHFEW